MLIKAKAYSQLDTYTELKFVDLIKNMQTQVTQEFN